jgi:glycosyltransferase involved in cell wall biosynthesis
VDYVEIRERHSLDLSIWPALRRLVRDRGIHIVHAHDYKSDVLAWLLGWCEGTVPLATAHGWAGSTAREWLFYYPADKRLLARFPGVIAVSEEIRRELVRCGTDPGRSEVVLNGIDAQVFRRQRGDEPSARTALGLPPDAIVVGSVGRLDPTKRFDLLIECLQRLRPEYPTMQLVIAGEGTERAALEDRIRALHLGEACRLLGLRADVPAVHHALDVFVQASDYEGTPNVVLEAMAFETPIVATDAGGTREIVRDGIDGLVVRCGDVAAMVDAIRCTLSDVTATRHRVASARARVEGELSFAARVAAVEAVYERLRTLFPHGWRGRGRGRRGHA